MKRFVLFGLDGATYTVLDDLIREGVMPYLGRFLQESAKGVLESVTPPLTPPAWTTLVTGRTPGRHGITGFVQFRSADSDQLQIASSRDVHCETIWSLVNRYGLRAGCLNFVLHAPPPRFDGFVVPGWTPWRWLGRFTRPRGLMEELAADIDDFSVQQLAMDYEIERKAVAGAPLDDYESWINLHIQRDRQWFQVLRRQMQKDPTELLGIVFDGVDKLQHLLWPYVDPACADQASDERWRRVREVCLEYYRQIDRFLEETVELAGPEAHVMIASDHGFTGGEDILYINRWLEQQGYLTWKESVQSVGESAELEPDFYQLAAFDMTKTKAFALTASSNGIHIAVRGRRSADGIPPEEYESFRRELTEALLTRCLHPQTGQPLVTRVWRREEIFAGPYEGLAPDLTLTLRDHIFFSVRRGESILVKRPALTGTHHPDGVFALRGPGVRRGEDIGRLGLVDVAPTIFRCLGLEPVEEFEGVAAEAAFSAPSTARVAAEVNGSHAPASLVDAEPAAPGEEEGDDEELIQRLKALGYIE
ncbi:MAG: hypothetical protein GC160_05030 [Acidobacteria bacterium]|nr:hypothetical protein [Acidobacteriota bacterium]